MDVTAATSSTANVYASLYRYRNDISLNIGAVVPLLCTCCQVIEQHEIYRSAAEDAHSDMDGILLILCVADDAHRSKFSAHPPTLSLVLLFPQSTPPLMAASLYVLQNSLQFYAISNLDAATFQITSQFKILPTALFSIILLRRRLSPRQWFALGLLIIGVVILQKPAADTASMPLLKDHRTGYHFPWALGGFRGVGTPALAPLSKRSATYEGIQEDDALEYPKTDGSMGVAAALMGCVVSSLASVYFEKILKDASNPVSLWVRNVQLSFYSMFPALFIGVFYMDGEKIAQDGFFAGYNWIVWTVLILQAIGGMVVSMCVNYADNISKSFAMSISILISLCASIIFFDFKMTTNFVLGSLVVTLATVLYSQRERRMPPAPIRIHDFEKTTIDPKSAKDRITPMKHPSTPSRSDGKSSSRPSSPGRHHSRLGSSRGYFGSRDRDEDYSCA
ncbi:MAG: hypothetical protein Q9224_002672 [Gallowayella concinna]